MHIRHMRRDDLYSVCPLTGLEEELIIDHCRKRDGFGVVAVNDVGTVMGVLLYIIVKKTIYVNYLYIDEPEALDVILEYLLKKGKRKAIRMRVDFDLELCNRLKEDGFRALRTFDDGRIEFVYSSAFFFKAVS